MKTNIKPILAAIGLLVAGNVAAAAVMESCELVRLGEGHSILIPKKDAKYLLLPIQESSPEARIAVVNANQTKESINVRLATDKIDYFVPYHLEDGDKFYIHEQFNRSGENLHASDAGNSGIWMEKVELSDTFDTNKPEKYRPLYHFSPGYGWMNDPNGMFYKDGVFHLYYQHNPYAAVWGNMNWGHATSRDLVHWQHEPVAIAPDAWGAIFSGSCVVDKNNTSGFGKDAVVAIYTSAGERQMQSIAYSNDNGLTFKKYAGNPVVMSDVADFRDPKVFWHEATKKWIMVLAVGQEMQFRSSDDLKTWKYESSFGEGEGCHDGVWECPDLVELPVEGTNETRWMLICNINPGGPAGGSATQYFTGAFDGKKFVTDAPGVTKWMDYGKDHYATVTWSNVPDNRCVAIAWMSNWQYANVTPTKYFTSTNSIPRDLSLYSYDGNIYVKSAPVPEFEQYMQQASIKSRLSVGKKVSAVAIPKTVDGNSFVMDLTVKKGSASNFTMALVSSAGERVEMRYDGENFAFDRTKSGNVEFSDDFPSVTVAPVNDDSNTVDLRIFVDKASVEVFGNGGKFVQSNLVYPSQPFEKIEFIAEGGKSKVENLKIYKLKL